MHTILPMSRIPWARDELLLACALVMENGWRELRQHDVRVTELSEVLRALPLHTGAAARDARFRSSNSVSRKTTDIMTSHPEYAGARTKGGRLTEAVVMDFLTRPDDMRAAAEALRAGVTSGQLHLIPAQPEEDGDDGATSAREGRLLARWALYRERDRGLRDRKIKEARMLGRAIRCEVCAFDFRAAYGNLGDGYIEVHHVTPLHVAGPSETTLDALAFLCANCHRMCHRSYAGESWRTPAVLRAEMRALRVSGTP